jgi:hypothetical protein
MEEEITFQSRDHKYRPFLRGSQYNKDWLNNWTVRSTVPRPKLLAKSGISLIYMLMAYLTTLSVT